MRYRLLLLSAAISLTAQAAWAAPVDLTTWTADNPPSVSIGQWDVAPDGLSVEQKINTGQPTVFFDAGSSAQSQNISTTVRVEDNDDDLIGFVLGYQAGEFGSSSAEYWLLNWSAGTNGTSMGLNLLHIVGGPLGTAETISGVGAAQSVTAAATLGSTAWARDTTYTFDIAFRAGSLDVSVNGVSQFSETGTFSDGAFGFYNFSQAGVTYTADITPAAPVPVPASLPLLLAGIAGLAWRARKRR